MTSIIESGKLLIDPKDNDKWNSDYKEDTDTFFFEYDHEEQEKFKLDDDDDQSRDDQLWQKSAKSLFDDGIFTKVIEKHEEEEEEEFADSKSQDFSPIQYDLTRFGYAPLSEEERRDTIAKLKELNVETRVLTVKNKFLHRHYINAIRNAASFFNALETFDENLIFQDDRYQEALENFVQTRDDVKNRRASLTTELESLEKLHSEAESRFKSIFENLQAAELSVAKKIRPRKSSREAWLSKVEGMLENQRSRVADVTKTRLGHLRLQRRLEELRAKLSEFDKLGAGLSMLDYELLLERKAVHSGKRDAQRHGLERLAGMNLACAATVRHIDEESDIYNERLKGKSDDLEILSNKNKVEYAKYVELVKERALLFKDIVKLREDIGLLDNPNLLRKMESDMRTISKLKKQSQIIETKMRGDKKRMSLMY